MCVEQVCQVSMQNGLRGAGISPLQRRCDGDPVFGLCPVRRTELILQRQIRPLPIILLAPVPYQQSLH